MKKTSFAKKLGHGFAYLQDGVDRAANWGLKKLKSAGQKKVSPTANPVKKTAKKTAKFIGEMGTEYFKKYEKLKEERAKAKKH